MSALFEYIKWRGDLDFRVVAPGCVDALVFSALAYLDFTDIVPMEPYGSVALPEAADQLLAMPEAAQRCRVRNDLTLLRYAADSARFGNCRIAFYRDIFVPEEEIQFAAMTFLLPDGSAFLAFRGTDTTLVGWKEDFNMSFRDTVPAQTAALEYTLAFAQTNTLPMHLGGHSKGGNLAVYAGAKCGPSVQKRIVGVYNNDGPGFRAAMMEDPGYRSIVPRIYTYVPQSSVIGMMLEHEEPFLVVKSKQLGVMQHDPYSWEILGGDFIRVEEVTEDSKFLDRALKTWLEGLDEAERNSLVDTVFDLLESGGMDSTWDLIRPKNVKLLVQNLKSDENAKKLLATELAGLIHAARKAQKEEKEE